MYVVIMSKEDMMNTIRHLLRRREDNTPVVPMPTSTNALPYLATYQEGVERKPLPTSAFFDVR